MFNVQRSILNVKLHSLIKQTILTGIVSAVSILSVATPTHPAEKINFNYSLLGFSVKVADLELFAREGKVTRQLDFYLKRISPEQREQLQEFLQLNYEIDPVLVYRFSRTSVGKKMLERFGKIIQIPHNTNGFYGLRAAAVQTAADRDGVNVISFLKYFPTDIKLNLSELLALLKAVSRQQKETEKFISQLEKQNHNDKTKTNTNSVDLSLAGDLSVSKQTLNIYDSQRERKLITDLYLPQASQQQSPIPTIIVSNGLGAKRDRFKELAQYLASHGFAVVIPDHPGSDRKRQKAFLRGLHKENFDSNEFIDRPQDIKAILDRLEEINSKALDSKLALDRVGIFGYSLGSTTALSLAGAEINFERLEEKCSESLNLLNISILYQCRALELTPQKYNLQDSRISAIYMFAPFGNSLFGDRELQNISIPTLWQTVDRDFLTSLLDEQLPAFNSLTTSDRYLVVSENIPHTNVTIGNQGSDKQQEVSQIAKKYQNVLSLAFFKTHIAEESAYKNYLTPQYLQQISQSPYKLHLKTPEYNNSKLTR